MQSTSEIGLFGKLPAHGDFIERNLPRQFVSVWDEWLQRCLATSQDRAGEQWLEHFLTSPVWRFALGHGAVDQHGWVGILVPSVDSVGRYFPITVAIKLLPHQDPFDTLLNRPDFFTEITDSALEALHNALDADNLWQQLCNSATNFSVDKTDIKSYIEQYGVNVCQTSNQSTAALAAKLLYPLSRLSSASSSLWLCEGAPDILPSIFSAPNLPHPECFLPMITNDWNSI